MHYLRCDFLHATKVHLFMIPCDNGGQSSSDAFCDDNETQGKQSVASQ